VTPAGGRGYNGSSAPPDPLPRTRRAAMHDPAALAARLDRLETENRRWRRVALGGLLALTGFLGLGLAPRVPEELHARRFVLEDAEGKPTAVLEHDPQGYPILSMTRGSAQALLSLAGPGLLLRGPDGKRGAYLGLDGRGWTQLELTSERLFDGVRLSVKPDGSSGIYLLDENGRDRAGLDLPRGRGAAFQVRDSDSKLRVQLGVDESDTPNVILLDRKGRRRQGMILDAEGIPYFAQEDEQGRTRVQLTELFDGTPSLKLLNGDGGSAFEAP